MNGLMWCVVAVTMLIPAGGEEKEQSEQLMKVEVEEERLECFRCDLGFWDACYTTETQCGAGERCYTGRGKAADVLDIKTLGCAKAEQCDVETTVELLSNNTVFVMTKHCCDTHFCNSARTHLQGITLLQLTAAALGAWCFAEAAVRFQ